MSRTIKARESLQENFNQIIANQKAIFEVDLNIDELWELYLNSFSPEYNTLYRERMSCDCNTCKTLIKKAGNIVVINDDYTLSSIFDVHTGESEYQQVFDKLNEFVLQHKIKNTFYHYEAKIAHNQNRALIDDVLVTFNHLSLKLPQFAVVNKDIIATKKGEYNSLFQTFKRSLEEITIDALDTILELIYSNSIYKGEEWKQILITFKQLKEEYDNIGEEKKDNYCWLQLFNVSATIARLRNVSIGTLLLDVSNGIDLEKAVKSFETIVAPQNYKRSASIITKTMINNAEKDIAALGLTNSLERRHANINDISINDILFADRNIKTTPEGTLSIFDELKSEVSAKAKDFSKVEEVHIDKFIQDVLPTIKTMEVYMENKLENKLVSLIAPENPEAPNMLKWDNNFSWSYKDNVTDSIIKSNVQKAGGDVNGVLRFSLQWNDGDIYNNIDFDAHCQTPRGHIYYGDQRDDKTGGILDVDIIAPIKNTSAVENITWSNRDNMLTGVYKFKIHNYNDINSYEGFKCELEFDDTIYTFNYPHIVKGKDDVDICEVHVDENKNFTLKEILPSIGNTTEGKTVWNIQTNEFIPVELMLLSPNYWNEQQIGNKHYMFMLKDCKNDEEPNGFYNEFLHQDLHKHKKVFEILGNKMQVSKSDTELSGLGFSSTLSSELIVRVTGKTKRIIKIKF